ncbi:MAG: alanine--tRNA ligase-related protein, partial [Candidatus Pacearchaeota archaeon]|nr:alanine--tRNA ligase-related protein [Candidatus Pacearchaeota archaeon]
MITRKTLIAKYLDFFKSKNHKIIPSESLIPKNDPTVLFTTAGMHPLVPYLLGQRHPLGKRLANVQRCIRTTDIDAVGDGFHHTFFEMLGNWSLGDYWKKEAIEWSYEFLIKILKIDKKKLSVTCFAGDKDAPKDVESANIWKSLGIKKIKFLGKEYNWWGPAGKTGPCGPDTEMFVNGIEIWNDVFMQYNKDENGKFLPAKQKNVDTGMGVERTLAILNGLDDNYMTEVWKPIIKQIEKLSSKKYKGNEKAMRIIADHIKAAVFIIADGIVPSNTEQGYVLRRLIRRAVRYGRELGIKDFTSKIAEPVFDIYGDYKELQRNKKEILNVLSGEEVKFN